MAKLGMRSVKMPNGIYRNFSLLKQGKYIFCYLPDPSKKSGYHKINSPSIDKCFDEEDQINQLCQRIEEYYQNRAAEIKATQNPEIEFCLLSWLRKDKFGKIDIKKASYDRDELAANQFIAACDELGYKHIKDLTKEHCQEVIDQCAEKGYSLSTLKQIRCLVNSWLSHCVEADEIELSKNPFSDVKLPKDESILAHREKLGIREREANRVLTEDEIKSIYDVIENGAIHINKSRSGNEYKTVSMPTQGEWVILALNTGLRGGELCGLKYSDIDFKKHTLSVNRSISQSLERDETGGVVKQVNRKKHTITKKHTDSYEQSPKTKSSKASIYISDYVVDVLKKMQAKEPEGYDGYIIHDDNHDHLSVHGLGDRWKRICKSAGVKLPCGLHVIRHTYGSLVYAKTNDIGFTSRQLRHKKVSTTMNIYVNRTEKDPELISKVKI